MAIALWSAVMVIVNVAFTTGLMAQTSGPTAGTNSVNGALPMVILESKEPIVGDQRVPCTCQFLFPADVPAAGTNVLPGLIKLHGATSQAYAKKSFAVSLDVPLVLLGMRTNAHWILNASYIDRSLMRHKLAYDLFKSLSTDDAKRYAVSSEFVEVRLNHRYHGVYLLMERVDRALLDLSAYQSNATSHACIYKAIDHAANFARAGHAGFEQREPEPLTGVWWQPLDHFNRFVSSAPDLEFFHPHTGIASRLDLDNATDFLLLVLLTANMDGITKNFILARDALTTATPHPRFFFAPWDYDGTFGRNWDATPVEPTVWLSNHLFDRLLGDAAWRDRLAARWKQLRESQFSVKTIQARIDSNAGVLAEAIQRNETRWPARNGPYPDKLSFTEDVAQMKSWIQARVQWLDAEIQRRTGAPAK
ncbi:MAG: spore coat protein [Verrucomicrobiota bacterium]|jgi:hypothetical protein